tara:strand:- start:2307 stop:3617 length:1311 start_codon:yes stop_codon:yes gene_type:complete
MSALQDLVAPTTVVNVMDTEPDSLNMDCCNIKDFSYETIQSLGNKVRLSDSNDKGLELYCYLHCNASDNETLQQCRGVVVHNQKIVMKAFPYTIEYDHDDQENISKNIEPIFNGCKFFEAYEGALIRMFYFDNQWYVCTHRKLNAFRSKWASSESFGTCFKKALLEELNYNKEFYDACYSEENNDNILDRFQSTLDITKQYMFLVRHSKENRIVCEVPTGNISKVYHVGTFINGELDMTDKCLLNYPTQKFFDSLDDLKNFVGNIDVKKLQGIIVFTPNNKQFKINHKEYNELFKIRGNEPSIKFRYLQIRMTRRSLNILYYLYPEMHTTFDEIENSIYDIARNIYSSYIQRFIKKRFVTVPIEEFAVIRECHSWHEEDRVHNRISLEKVISILNKQSPTAINHMIRRLKVERDQKKNDTKIIDRKKRSSTITSES